MKKPEKIIEREILIWLNRLPNSYFWKNETVGVYDTSSKAYRKPANPYVIRGVSDIIGLINGSTVFIEVKTPTGRTSPAQDHFIEKINSLGGLAFVARSIKDVKEVFISKGLINADDDQNKRQELPQ